MIKHLISIIWNQRKSNAWLWTELLLVSVFLWFIVDYMLMIGSLVTRPLGFDTEHTYYIAMNSLGAESKEYIPQEAKFTTSGEDLLTVADRIRTFPGVEAVSYSRRSYPYSEGIHGRMIGGVDTTHYYYARRRMVTPDYFKVFNIKTKDGKDISVDRLNGSVRVITESLAHDFFGEADGVGKPTHYSFEKEKFDETNKKVAVVSEDILDSEFAGANNCFYDILMPDVIAEAEAEDVYVTDLCIRVSPEADKDFAERFRREIDTRLRVGNLFLLDIQPVESFHADYVREAKNDVRSQLAVLFFLLINIFLGIIGTFWVRTQYRKGEMGLRIALGSTPSGLRSILIVEGIILLILAIIPSAIICLNVGFTDIMASHPGFSFGRYCLGIFITFLLMSVMIIIGIWWPARQVIKIHPAEALHYE